MKKLIILTLKAFVSVPFAFGYRYQRTAIAGGLALMLAACDPATQAAQISKVQQEAQLFCSFVPTASTIASLLSVFVPTAGSVVDITTQVANGICAQISALKSSGRRAADAGPTLSVYVQGVKITGTLK